MTHTYLINAKICWDFIKSNENYCKMYAKLKIIKSINFKIKGAKHPCTPH